MSTLDPLSDVLRSVRLRGSVFFHVSCRGEWAAQAPPSRELSPAVMPGAEHVIEYHMFIKGGGWVAVHLCQCRDVSKRRGAPAGEVQLRRWDSVKAKPAQID